MHLSERIAREIMRKPGEKIRLTSSSPHFELAVSVDPAQSYLNLDMCDKDTEPFTEQEIEKLTSTRIRSIRLEGKDHERKDIFKIDIDKRLLRYHTKMQPLRLTNPEQDEIYSIIKREFMDFQKERIAGIYMMIRSFQFNPELMVCGKKGCYTIHAAFHDNTNNYSISYSGGNLLCNLDRMVRRMNSYRGLDLRQLDYDR